MRLPTLRLHFLQKLSMSVMAVLVMLTFVGTNLQAILWQSSDWLISTVLPAVVIDLTNDERSDNSAAPLTRNVTLDKAAKMKAEDMAKNEYFAHFSPKGVSPWHWFDEAGYVYAHAGENLAIHFTDSSEVVEAWMKSPTHRKNIVDGKYTEIGVGTARGKFEGYETVYVVQLFGTPAIKPAPVVEPTPVIEPEVVEIPAIALAAEPEILAEETSLEAPVVTEVSVPETLPTEPVVTTDPEVAENTSVPVGAAEEVVEEVVSEPVLTPVEVTPVDEVYVVESPIISTSSGLAVAQITTDPQSHAGATIASVATQPSHLLQIAYMTLGFVVVMLLSASVVLEARRLHYMQVAYGLVLLFVMGGLWYAHSLLTAGAVIV